MFKDDVFYINLDLIQIDSNTFEQVYNFTENGSYKIEIESGKFMSSLYGITEAFILPFVIADADYDADYDDEDYDNDEYLT